LILQNPGTGTPAGENNFRTQRDKHLNQVEKSLIKRYLQETGGNVSLAARKAGIPRRTFYRLLTRYDIQGENFRVKNPNTP
jgi:transcriptional regulator of acetoin/glycerol metabolism